MVGKREHQPALLMENNDDDDDDGKDDKIMMINYYDGRNDDKLRKRMVLEVSILVATVLCVFI